MAFSTLVGEGAFHRETKDKINTNFTQTVEMLSAAPSTATSAGTVNQIAFDATHIYVCIATNVWVRATLATF